MDGDSEKTDAFYITEERMPNKQAKAPCGSLLIKALAFTCLVFTTYLLVRLERQQHQSELSSHAMADNRPGYASLHVTRPGYVRAARQWEAGDEDTREDVESDDEDDADTVEEADEAPGAVWGEWSRWSRCSSRKFCQEGSQHRKRKCVSIDEKNDHCTGVSMESRDCPAGSCSFNYNRQPQLSDESPAAGTSFIGQECNATTKYYGRGKYADQIPQAVFSLFPGARKMMSSGFYAVQVIPKVLSNEDTIIKVCFEPFGRWSLPAVRRTFKLNRSTKASLKGMRSTNLIGLAIGLRPDESLYGVLVATGTPGAMYSAVYYRRWRGRSFQEDYLTF